MKEACVHYLSAFTFVSVSRLPAQVKPLHKLPLLFAPAVFAHLNYHIFVTDSFWFYLLVSFGSSRPLEVTEFFNGTFELCTFIVCLFSKQIPLTKKSRSCHSCRRSSCCVAVRWAWGGWWELGRVPLPRGSVELLRTGSAVVCHVETTRSWRYASFFVSWNIDLFLVRNYDFRNQKNFFFFFVLL